MSQPKAIPRMSQFPRFLVAGGVNALAGFLLFLLFFKVFDWHYLFANLLVFLSWAWFGFELQRRWAFKAEKSRGTFLKYLLNQVGFIALGTLMLWMLVEFAALRPEVAYVMTIGLITLGIYASSRLWVFRHPKRPQ